jgi:hypothetical protein
MVLALLALSATLATGAAEAAANDNACGKAREFQNFVRESCTFDARVSYTAMAGATCVVGGPAFAAGCAAAMWSNSGKICTAGKVAASLAVAYSCK